MPRDCYGTEGECQAFVRGLSETVRERALPFFEALAREGRIDSVQVADDILDCKRSEIGANLTIWIATSAKQLGCPLPYDGGLGALPYGGISNPGASDDRERTYYVDRDGIAGRMVEALRRLS